MDGSSGKIIGLCGDGCQLVDNAGDGLSRKESMSVLQKMLFGINAVEGLGIQIHIQDFTFIYQFSRFFRMGGKIRLKIGGSRSIIRSTGDYIILGVHNKYY